MKKIIIIAFTCFIASATFSQSTIQGRVIDKNSQGPLELAYVRWSNTTQGVVTNKQGYFNLTKTAAENDAALIVSFIGFTTKEIKATSNSPVVVEMEKGRISLQEVVITPQSTA